MCVVGMALAYEGALGTVEIAATTSSIAGWVNQLHFHPCLYMFTCKGDLPSLVGKYISRQQGRSFLRAGIDSGVDNCGPTDRKDTALGTETITTLVNV